jgi:nucleotide-binding universal stress UspA family protein
MGYKSITMIVTDAQADARALAAAVSVAQREDAHLDVHCMGIDPARYDVTAVGATAGMLDYGIAEARQRADELLAWVTATIPRGMERVSIHPVVIPYMGLDSGVARMARYADLIVATKPYDAERLPVQASVVEAVLFGTGAPVLIVPAHPYNYDKGFERIMVAWDESDQSFSAVRKALPLLQAASRVDIVLVDPPSHSPERSDPGGSVCLMLARHGVRAEVSILARTMPRISEVLMRFAREHAIDLVVMGAYGHSRFREAVLGGATRDALEVSNVPLLMAH